jgi:hypothetical protein
MDVVSEGMATMGQAQTSDAYARATNVQAASAELDLALRKKLIQDTPKLLQQGQPGGSTDKNAPQDPTSTLMRLGEWYTEHGDPTTGGQIMSQASLIGQHQSSVLLNGVRANTLVMNQQQQQLEAKGQLLGMVNDEASWQSYLQEAGHPEAIGKVAYPGPEGIRHMQEGLLKLKDQLQMKAKDKSDTILGKLRETQIWLDKLRGNYVKEQTEDKKRGKGTAKDPRLPQTVLFKDAQAMVKSKHGAWTGEKSDALAYAVAADANEAMVKNPALQMQEALDAAYANREKDAKLLDAGDKNAPAPPPGFTLGIPDNADITNLPEEDADMQTVRSKHYPFMYFTPNIDALHGDTGEQQ